MSEPAAGTAFPARRTRARAAATCCWPGLPERARTRPWRRWPAALRKDVGPILEANATDVAAAGSAGVPDHLIDRLRLDRSRVEAMAEGLRQVAGLPDPVGEVIRGWTQPNGLEIRQIRVPLGVVAMVYEARPNVTVDAAGLCLKSGNAALLRGSPARGIQHRHRRDDARRRRETGLTADVVQLVRARPRVVKELMRARGLVDVLIPRGGAGLIRSVVEESTVPVIETGVGNCHVYVDAAADLPWPSDRAERQDPAPVGVQRRRVAAGSPDVAEGSCRGSSRRCRTRRDRARRRDGRPPGGVEPATEEDWAHEYLALEISAAVVRRSMRRSSTSAATPRRTPTPSSPTPSGTPSTSSRRWTRPRSWSTPRPASPTAVSSASARRSASPRRSCTPAARWDCPR